MATSRRGFIGSAIAAACTAGGVGGAQAAGAKKAAGHPIWGLPVAEPKTLRYFTGGWAVHMFGNRGYGQMLSTLFVSPSGKLVMVDGGNVADADFLHDTLMRLGGKVDTWFITHAHVDHFGALGEILKKPNLDGLKVGRFLYEFPTVEWVAKWEKSELKRLQAFLSLVRKSRVPVETTKCRAKYDFGEGLVFECLNNFDERIHHNAINNGSICMLAHNGDKKLLITGDTGVEMGLQVLKIWPEGKLKADVVFMSHHGQNGASREFYAAVKPEICVWPTPRHVWDNDPAGLGPGSGGWQTNYVKCWMQDLGAKRHYLLCNGDAVLLPKA